MFVIVKCKSIIITYTYTIFIPGIASIDNELLKKGCCIHRFFVDDDSIKTSLQDVRNWLTFHRPGDESNDDHAVENAIFEVELFLANLSNGMYSDITLKDFLIFSCGLDRIPVFGLPKKIEIFFVNDTKLPRASTCGLFLQIPVTISHEKIAYAVRNGIGYGFI